MIAAAMFILALAFVAHRALDSFTTVIDSTMQTAIDTVNQSNTNKQERLEEQAYHKIDDALSNKFLVLNLGSVDNQVELNTNYTGTVIEADSLYTDAPMEVTVNENSSGITDDMTISVNGQDISEENRIQVESLGKEEFVEIEVEQGNNLRVYYIQTLPSSFPEIEKHGISSYEGEYYSNFYLAHSSFIYKMSNDGDILYYKMDESERDGLVTFAKWDINGATRYSYFDENYEGAINVSSYNYGDYVIMDENYQEIDRIHALPSEKYPVNTNDKAETHDFIMLDDGHYIVLNYVMDTPKPEHVNGQLEMDTRVLAAYIQEIKDGEIVWEWLSTDYPEFYESSREGNDYSNASGYAQDYMHVNSIFVDPKDGNLIMSLRNQGSVVKIGRGSGEILWTFGGDHDDFELTREQSPSKQHHATMTDAGNLLIFDNGTANEQTRILEVTLDEENTEVLEFEEFLVEGNYGAYTGSVQKIDEENDVFVIGWGMERNHHALMSEIDFKNKIILSEVIEPTKTIDSYRFMKFE